MSTTASVVNRRQYLLPIYRKLRPFVDRFHLNSVARPIWALLWRSSGTQLIQARQNDRIWWLQPAVALGGEYYERETVAWLRSAIRPGMTVVDVGANVGQITLEMAHLVGPTGRVVSIEPSPGNVRFLKAHLEANGLAERVTIIEAACCAAAGAEMTLEILGDDPNSIQNGPQLKELSLGRSPVEFNRPRIQLRVPTTTLDAVCARLGLEVDVLKVDVEGAELEVFRGARQLLQGRRPRVIFGFHPYAFGDRNAAQAEIRQIFSAAGLAVENDAGQSEWGLQEYTVSAAHPRAVAAP